MDVLSKLLDKGASAHQFGYHPLCKNLRLTHLAFADDLMVLSDGKVRSVEGIVAVFDDFTKASGLCMSMEKSTIFLAGATEEVTLDIRTRFLFHVGQLPVRYLGLPLVTKCMTTQDYQPLPETIRKRIGSWTNRYLSYAGRLDLIGSVLWSISRFWLSDFRLPKACIREIDKICSGFFWSGPDLNPRKSKISWEDICRPKTEGGLGLRSLHDINKVTCLKLLWRLLTNLTSLWEKWIHTNLLKNEYIWSVKDDDKRGSWIWRKILKFREMARHLSRVEVNKGATTSFWFDIWSPMGCLMEVLGPEVRLIWELERTTQF